MNFCTLLHYFHLQKRTCLCDHIEHFTPCFMITKANCFITELLQKEYDTIKKVLTNGLMWCIILICNDFRNILEIQMQFK